MVSLIRTRSLALFLSLAIPVREAVAHPRLVKTDPAAGARVTAPRALALSFHEALTAALCRVTLLNGAMQPVTLGAVKSASGDPKTLSVVIHGSLAPGRYTVKWQVAGDDGHPVRGQYTFEVEAGAAGVTEPTDAEFGVESPAYVLLRAIQSIAVIALLGVLALHFLVGPRFARVVPDGVAALRIAETTAVRWLTPALALLLVATIGRLFAQQVALFGTQEMPTQASLSAILLQSPWGRSWLIAFGATIVGFVAARRLRGSGAKGWMLLAVAALALTYSMATSGHAAADSALSMTLHALHVIGAGGWIGSLGILMFVAVPAVLRSGGDEPHPSIAGLVRAFSPTALACASLVVATGVAAAWRNLGSASALWQSRYGQVLLAKLALLSIAGLAGFYNWRYVLPGLGGETATGRLRRSAAVELAAAALVLVVTAVLVATPMPASMIAAAPP